MAKKKTVAAKKTTKSAASSGSKRKPTTKASAAPKALAESLNGSSATAPPQIPRLLPTAVEMQSLYERYTQGARFDEHDKAFYFVLDVGGVNRARQLIAHVEEVLAELEEFGA